MQKQKLSDRLRVKYYAQSGTMSVASLYLGGVAEINAAVIGWLLL